MQHWGNCTLPAMKWKMKLATVEITKIINGGYGLAHLPSGQIVLVRHVLPGEIVTITTEKTKKNCILGEVEQIVAANPARRKPPCRYVGRCGGCDLQHCDYPSQLAIKKGIIEDLFLRSRSDAVREAVQLLAEPLGAPDDFGYRQRIRLQVDSGGALGFHRFQSHSVVPIDLCLLARQEENDVLFLLTSHPDGRKLTGNSVEVELQENPATGKTVVTFRMSRKPRPADMQAAERFCRTFEQIERVFLAGESFPLMGPYGQQQADTANSLAVRYPAIAGPPGLERDSFSLTWEAGGFCQVNLGQNINLIATVLGFSRVGPDDRLLDLYCGMGNFAIPLAMKAKEVVGIEGQGSAIRSAARNAAAAGLDNTRFRKSPIHEACTELIAGGEQFDCVVIDPPRQGAPDLAARLATLTRDRLIYISCDPATLVRDLADLGDHGFSIGKIQPVDMFPQTHHIETVVLLNRQ